MNRVFLLMAQFDRADVPLEEVIAKYFPHLSEREWKRRALMRDFPFPVFRSERSQKAPWMVNVSELATYLDAAEAEAKKDWKAA